PGTGANANLLQIVWDASDRNLARRPITLSYAEAPAGPWNLIAANLENSGKYTWTIPSNFPAHVLVKIEASDLVGNIGTAQIKEPLVFNMTPPAISICTVEAAIAK